MRKKIGPHLIEKFSALQGTGSSLPRLYYPTILSCTESVKIIMITIVVAAVVVVIVLITRIGIVNSVYISHVMIAMFVVQ